MRFVLALLVLSAGCGGAPASASRYAPSEVRELSSLPAGYAAGDELSESCSVVKRGSFEDESLDDVDCSFARLSRTLRARAGERSSRFLVGKRCRADAGSRPRLSCSGVLAVATNAVSFKDASARAETGPGPSAAQVQDLDEARPQDAARIRVSFRSSGASFEVLPPRAYDLVAETRYPSVGRRELGQVSARCASACDDRSLRHALRVAAGKVGAGEVSQVACFSESDGARCVATALVPWSS